MEKQTNKKNSFLKKIVTQMVEHEVYGWPPECPTLFYQPERPVHMPKIDLNGETERDNS